MATFRENLAAYSGYFGELRRRLFSLVKIFFVVFVAGFFSTSALIKLFVEHLAIKDVLIVTSSPFQLIDLAMSIGIFFASVIVTPFFVYHMYAFLREGLHAKERKLFLSLIPVAIILFFLGFAYGFATLYFAMELIAGVNVSLGVVNYWDIGRFVSEIVLTSSLLGLVFEFPIIITFLIRLGMLSPQFLRDKRRHAAVGIFIFVSLLPPTDGLSLILMAAPLVAMYECTIFINRKRGKDTILLE